MSSGSPFTVSPHEAGLLVRSKRKDYEEDKKCYLLQVSFQPLYCDAEIPNSCIRKLPRVVNGIPLGAGVMPCDQMRGSIRWKYVEGGKKVHTFISVPISEEEAKETKTLLKYRFLKQSHDIFGDVTIKATIVLSLCLNYEADLIINDIAESLDEGLHFRD